MRANWIKYEIYAYDNAGNGALRDNAGAYYDLVYHVIPPIPEFSSIVAPLFFGLATSMTALLYRKVLRKRD